MNELRAASGELRIASVERATMRRVTRRLIPFLFTLYVFNFLDRFNVGFAALHMNADLGFTDQVFSFGAGVFFLGYSLFEIPSNLLLVRFGVRVWVARIMITWGLIAAAMMFVRTPPQFYMLRLLLGIAEAGFYPAILFYLTRWYPASMRARSAGLVLMAIPLSGVIGNPLSGALLGLNGRLGLAGWQWLFLLEGLPTVALGVAVLRYLPERPEEARWLSEAERAWLVGRLARDRSQSAVRHEQSPLAALANPAIWLAAVPQFLIVTGGYAFLFWGPTIVHEALGTGDLGTGLVLGATAALSAVALVFAGWLSDRTGERPRQAAAWAGLFGAGAAAAALVPDPLARVGCLVVMQVAVGGFLAPFAAIPPMLLGGSSIAVGYALINAIGNIGGFVGPNLIGYMRTRTGGDEGAFLGLAVMAFVAAGVCFLIRAPKS